MEVFGADLEKLREDGIGIGLDDEQIDRCMVEALRAAKKSLTPSHGKPAAVATPNTAGKRGTATKPSLKPDHKHKPRKNCCRYFLLTILCLVCVGAGIMVLVEYYPPATRFVMTIAESCIFSVARWWRLLTLPLARSMDLTFLYNDMCVISNPFMKIQPAPCDSKEQVTNVISLENITRKEFAKRYHSSAKVLLLKNNATHRVPYTTLRSWYRENEDSFRMSANKLNTASGSARTIEDILTNYTARNIKFQADFHVDWFSNSVNPSRLLRKIFPRPHFIPSYSEVGIDKVLLVDSPSKGVYTLPVPSNAMPNHWYVQGGGSRQFFFHPYTECAPQGTTLTTTLHTGDIVFFYGPYWRVESGPSLGEDGDDVSVAFIGSFM